MAYHHYYLTGRQDCDNAFSVDEFRDAIDERHMSDRAPEDLAVEIVAQVTSTWSDDTSWHEQNDEDIHEEGLDPAICYAEWLRGWQDVARIIVAKAIVTSRARHACPHCGKRRTLVGHGVGDECGGEGSGICEGYANEIDGARS